MNHFHDWNREGKRQKAKPCKKVGGRLYGIPCFVEGNVFRDRGGVFVFVTGFSEFLGECGDTCAVHEPGFARQPEFATGGPPEGIIGYFVLATDAGEIVEVFETRTVGSTPDLGPIGWKRTEKSPHLFARDTLECVGLNGLTVPKLQS